MSAKSATETSGAQRAKSIRDKAYGFDLMIIAGFVDRKKAAQALRIARKLK